MNSRPEGELARYRTSHGEATLAIFSYPNMQMARQQAAILEKLPDAAVKRTGPLVALVLAPGGQAAAAQLLGQIDYKATVSSDDQQIPLVIRPQTAAQMVLGILALAGIVLGFCLLSGHGLWSMASSGSKVWLLRCWNGNDDAPSERQITPRLSPA